MYQKTYQCAAKKKKKRHDHKGIVMNELKHIHVLCWQHIYSGEFTFCIYVRDGSQNCLQKLRPILLTVLRGVRWIAINRWQSSKAVLESLHRPLHSTPCPGRLICVSCVKTLCLWLSLNFIQREALSEIWRRGRKWAQRCGCLPPFTCISFHIPIAASSFYPFQAHRTKVPLYPLLVSHYHLYIFCKYSGPLNNARVKGANPRTVKNLYIIFDSPKSYVVSQYPQGINSGTHPPTMDTQIHRCSSSLY